MILLKVLKWTMISVVTFVILSLAFWGGAVLWSLRDFHGFGN